MTQNIYVNDVGAGVIINLESTNIAVSTTVKVIVENPFGATVEWSLEAGELNKTTGIITHKSKAGEIPYEGEYKVQCIRTDTGVNFGSGIDYFKALKRL
jgi:hypothetical protein